MKDVLLATFNDKEPAQNLQNRLQQAGVRAILSDDTKLQRFWFISEPLGAFHLQVLRDDHQKAARLLEQWDQAEAILKDAVRCPVCHSTRVEFPQLTRKFVLPSVGSLLMAIGLIPREFYCCDC